jgi:hypothetical protein
VCQAAFFSGEGEPIPREIELAQPIYEWEVPYLCTPDGLISLAPGLVYEPRGSDGRLGLHVVDGIEPEALRYKSVQDGVGITSVEGVRDMAGWVHLPFEVKAAGARKPCLEHVSCPDGRTLFGFLSGAEVAARPEAEEVAAEAGDGGNREHEPEMAAPTSMRAFEERVSQRGLGMAYRDILYAFADHGAHAELVGEGIRVMGKSEPRRVLATVQLTGTSTLLVSLMQGALTSGEKDQTESYELRAGETADAVVERIGTLIGEGGAVAG